MSFRKICLDIRFCRVNLSVRGLRQGRGSKILQNDPPQLQTPQTLKLSRSTHNENFMVSWPMVGLQYCQTVLSANRPGQSYGVAKSVHLTVKYNRFVLLVCTLVAKCIKIAMYMEFGFFCPYFALMAM